MSGSTSPTSDSPISVFISYSHKDEDLREELDIHLANLKHQGKILAWHDRAIEAGTEWDAQIKHQLETAQVILLLISPRFIASNYCYDLEMQRAIERHDEGTARVIPIILKPCDWQGSPFRKLQVLPKDAKPVTKWDDKDEAFLNVVQGIRRVVESLQATNAKKPLTEELRNSHPINTFSQTHNLTGKQLTILRWFVEEVRAGKLDEEEIWIVQDFNGTHVLNYDGNAPEIKSTTLNALYSNGCISSSHSTNSGYRFSLTRRAYEIVDSTPLVELQRENPPKKQLGATLADSATAIAPSSTPSSPSPPSLPHFSTYTPQTFTGRADAIAHLTETLTSGCRLLIIHGMTGIGKTALAESLFANFFTSSPPSPSAPSFSPLPYIQVILDRGISSPDFTRGAISILHAMGDDTAQQLPDDQILPYLLKILTEKPCRLQLDSLEFLLRQDENGDYHYTDPTWTDFFCQFLTYVGVQPNAPTIVLTSQALPIDLVEGCDRLSNLWHDYSLRGLDENHWLNLFHNYGVRMQNSTEEDYLCQIARYFDGHPLILKMIAGDIAKPLFKGSVTKYWRNYYNQQTRPKMHQSQEQRARYWVNQTLQTLPPLALQMLQRCSVFRRPVPESFYLQILDTPTSPITSISPTDLTSTLNTLKSRYLVEEKDIQNGEILLQLHNLIRDDVYTQLKADRPTWEAAERKAADLWLTVYQPAPDAENLETVRGYLEAFDHYCEVEDWEQAKTILLDQQIGLRLQTWGKYQEMIIAHQKLIGHLQAADEVACTKGLGNAHFFVSNYPQAIAFYEQSLSLAQGIGDQSGQWKALNNLSNVYTNLGNYPKSIECLQQTLIVAREIDDRQGEGYALGNLGLAHRRQGEYGQAIDYHQQNLTIAREIGDRQGESNALGSLGIAYEKLGKYGQAIDYHQQHLVIAREIGDHQGEGIALVNLGATQLKMEQYPDSLTNNQTALEIFREIGGRANEAVALKNLAELHQQLGESSVALEYCQQALALSTELGIPLLKECEELQLKIQNNKLQMEGEE